MTDTSRIRGLLLRNPKPTIVRVSGGEAPTQELRPGRSYVKCAETIAALDVDLVECLDGNGQLLRAFRVSEDARRSDAAPVPAGIAQDPQALLLTHFANLLHRAYEHSTEIAFTKMVEVFDTMGQRSEQIEQRLERSEAMNRRYANEQIDDAFARAAELAEQKGENGLLGEMASNFLSGALNKTANGTAPKKGQG